jgi:uncharacterized protein (TIGR03085 family)
VMRGKGGGEQASHATGMMAHMTHHAQAERAALCDTLEAVGPQAPTLCDPWDAAELAAHLVIRERRPDLAAGIVVPGLRARTERVQSEYAAKPWPELVGLVRSGPPVWSPARLGPVDEAYNLVEFFVHHEDVLRATATGPQREISGELQAALWSTLGRLGRLLFRRARTGVVLLSPGHGRYAVHGPTGLGTVILQGEPSELLLAGYGRPQVAALEPQGSEEAVNALMASRLGLA